jgi:hypothetical protein
MGRRARGACPRGSPSRSFPGFRGRSSTVVTTTVESVAPEPNRLVERVEAAGRRLTAASITWGARPAAGPALALTDRDVDLLAAVDEHRYLTTSMLALLFWGSDSYAARRRLKKLHDAGLLEKFRPAVATGGSHEWIYRLTESGWDVLAAEGEPSGGRAPRELHYLGYVQHDLEVSSLVLTLALRTALVTARWPGDCRSSGTDPTAAASTRPASVSMGVPRPRRRCQPNGEFMREAAAAM